MRLINVHTYQLEEFIDENQVPYAILSHRWEEEEVLFDHMVHRFCTPDVKYQRRGWAKIEQCCRQAKADGYTHVWIDTCCINKESSAELQESINSMYRWYAKAGVCYAFLSDVENLAQLGQSLWFLRGWTLQELLAPQTVQFWSRSWHQLGDRQTLDSQISKITSIRSVHLQHFHTGQAKRPWHCEVMSWAAKRRTTRLEDRAYSLLGLFDVSMPLLYGEGNKAFQRLQEAILSRSNDSSLFLWSGVRERVRDEPPRSGLLANSPEQFEHVAELRVTKDSESPLLLTSSPHYPYATEASVTNLGIAINFMLFPVRPTIYLAALIVERFPYNTAIGIYLRHLKDNYYERIAWDAKDTVHFNLSWNIDVSLLDQSLSPAWREMSFGAEAI